MHRDLYTELTDRIMGMLETGTVAWRNPIIGSHMIDQPTSLESGRAYRGINVFLLAMQAMEAGYRSRYWMTYRQIAKRGGHVTKGEKATLVVFWKSYSKRDQKTGETKVVPVLRYYHVFNLDQARGLDLASEQAQTPEREAQPIAACDAIVDGYVDGPTIEHDGMRAAYAARTDTVRIPKPEQFERDEDYYATLFHELIHSTGHSERIDRKLDTDPKPFGSPDYSKEELVAEMGSAFLCAKAAIAPTTIENAAAYIQGWLKALRNDKRLVVHAAGSAQRAADWILGERQRQR